MTDIQKLEFTFGLNEEEVKELANNVKNFDELSTNDVNDMKISEVLKEKILIFLQYNNEQNKPKIIKIKNSDDVFALTKSKINDYTNESLGVISLDKRGYVLDNNIVYNGTIDEMIVSFETIIDEVRKNNATNYILYHNHPSNNLMPSVNDINTTEILIGKSREINLKMTDHIIVCEDKYRSMREHLDVIFNM